MQYQAPSNLEEIHISAKVLRADGTVEDLGEVDAWFRNPLKRLAWRLLHRRLSKGV